MMMKMKKNKKYKGKKNSKKGRKRVRTAIITATAGTKAMHVMILLYASL